MDTTLNEITDDFFKVLGDYKIASELECFPKESFSSFLDAYKNVPQTELEVHGPDRMLKREKKLYQCDDNVLLLTICKNFVTRWLLR